MVGMDLDIYADIYFVINFSMDLICLYITSLCMSCTVKLKRLIFASCIGGIFSVLSLILEGNYIISFILTLFVGLLMCYTVFYQKHSGFKVVISFIIYLAVSFFMGGGLTFLYSWLNTNFSPISPLPPSATSLLFPAALLCAVASVFLSHISKRFLKAKQAEIHISHDEVDITLLALVDSGNLLSDPISGLPVILLSKEASLEFLPSDDFSPEFISDLPKFKRIIRVIPTKTIDGATILTAFIPQITEVNKERKKCLIAFSNAKSFGGCQALLPSSLLPVTGFAKFKNK